MLKKLVEILGNEPTTTSLIIAEGTEIQHKNIMELIRNYQSGLEEFGIITFEQWETKGRPTEFAILNEQQIIILVSHIKNTKKIQKL